MKRLVLMACAVLALAGCAFGGEGTVRSAADIAAASADAIGVKPPTPAADTAIDEQLVTIAIKGVDTAAISASALVRARVIAPGSPTALKLATALDRARHGVNAAAAARKVGNATSYRAALADAEAALAEIQTAIGG